jgi:phage replication initiation protein
MGAVAPMPNLRGVREVRGGADRDQAERVHGSLIDGVSQRLVDEAPAEHVASDLQITVWRTGHVNALVGKSKSSLAPTCAGQTQVRHKTPMFLRIPLTWVRIAVRVRIQLLGLRMFVSNCRDLQPGRAVGEADAPARRLADARQTPRVVTTGRKKAEAAQAVVVEGYFDTGERIEMTASGRSGIKLTRHLDPVPDARADAALIDALAFSVVPPDERSYTWVLEEMAQFLPIESIEYRRGLFGFRYSARIGEGVAVIAWGGESQRGRVFFSLMGQGCSLVRDWAALQAWLERHQAALKRADVAYDDHQGKLVSIEWAVEQYKGDGFNAGGRRPRSECFGDWLDGDASTKGRTLGIGSRASGKYARCYEKGKQLGDPASRWTRIEVEWRAQDRHIPYDILTKPGQYLAGAYPCLAVLDERQSTIKTVTKAARIAYARAVENAKLHCGKTVNLMLAVLGGDYAEVVKQLVRPGIPGRIDPYSYHVRQNPTMLDRALVGVAA